MLRLRCLFLSMILLATSQAVPLAVRAEIVTPETVAPLQETLCCLCTSGNQDFCLNQFSENNVTRCDQITTSRTKTGLAEQSSLVDGLNCHGERLSPGACQLRTENASGVCRNRPTTPAALITFLQQDLGITQTNANLEQMTGINPTSIPDMDADTVTTGAPPSLPVKPILGVNIPGLTFGDVTEDDTYTYVPFLGQYIAAIYRYLTGISALVATIMIIYGGFLYLVGAPNGGSKDGQKIITGAVSGLILIFVSYAILYTLNPATLNLQRLRIPKINVATSPLLSSTNTDTAGMAESSNISVTQPPVRVQGDIATIRYSYKPTNDQSWQDNQAQIIYPSRLSNQTRPVHLYIYIHGYNDGHAPSSQAAYTTALTGALRQVAGNRDIMIAAPHFMGGRERPDAFMTGFTLPAFLASVTQSLRAHAETANFEIADIVVTGHSAATCFGPQLLSKAGTSPLPGQIGIVSYDGCDISEPLSQFNGTILINTDGMGTDPQFGRGRSPKQRAIDRWSLTQVTPCPSYVSTDQVRSDSNPSGHVGGCFKNATGSVWLFSTNYGHRQSVGKMTDWAFQHFYNR